MNMNKLLVNVWIKENENLKKKNDQKNLEKLLSSKKCVFDKRGLEYKSNLKQKYYKNYFVEATSVSDHIVVCRYCNRNGHLSYTCSIEKNAYFRIICV